MTMKCCLCEKVAMVHVNQVGYCKDHLDKSVAANNRDKKQFDVRHGVTSYQYASERRDRGRA